MAHDVILNLGPLTLTALKQQSVSKCFFSQAYVNYMPKQYLSMYNFFIRMHLCKIVLSVFFFFFFNMQMLMCVSKQKPETETQRKSFAHFLIFLIYFFYHCCKFAVKYLF